LKQWVLKRQQNVCDEEQVRMPERSESQTEGAAMLKLRETKVVCGTDSRLVLEEYRERVRMW